MNTKITTIIDTLKDLTLLETNELIKEIERVFKIEAVSFPSAALQMNNNNTQALNQEISTKETSNEEISFTITLVEVPADKKIPILKVIRTITGFGLKESKEIVDNVPKIIKEGISKEDCDNFQKELEMAGAKVTIK